MTPISRSFLQVCLCPQGLIMPRSGLVFTRGYQLPVLAPSRDGTSQRLWGGRTGLSHYCRWAGNTLTLKAIIFLPWPKPGVYLPACSLEGWARASNGKWELSTLSTSDGGRPWPRVALENLPRRIAFVIGFPCHIQGTLDWESPSSGTGRKKDVTLWPEGQVHA